MHFDVICGAGALGNFHAYFIAKKAKKISRQAFLSFSLYALFISQEISKIVNIQSIPRKKIYNYTDLTVYDIYAYSNITI